MPLIDDSRPSAYSACSRYFIKLSAHIGPPGSSRANHERRRTRSAVRSGASRHRTLVLFQLAIDRVERYGPDNAVRGQPRRLSTRHARDDDTQPSRVPTLQPGQIRLTVERFALTTNNITYAVAGDMLDYWGFFPSR